jgi:hypothetical protein
MINENSRGADSWYGRSDVEVTPPGPGNLTGTDQLEVRLVDQRRRRQRVARPLARQALLGGSPQLVIDKWQQSIGSR